MNEFSKQANMCKKSIDWWREESIKTAFEAEELNFRYEIGELTEEELLAKTKELDNKILYLMSKGGFENRQLFETFAEYRK
tara:strand:- start:33 stop:275 length:243 start_codon:yes stop_codon:yes gene_type:complete